tara:strand:- start:19970 stop:20908 length:939 start_codon:yes stop_codon:yes gene_type:complete
MKTTNKANVYQKVNELVIEGLKSSGLQWFKAWKDADGNVLHPINRATKKRYNGVNIFLLNAYARHNEYPSNEWLSYKQAITLKGNVRKGEKGVSVVYWNIAYKIDDKWFPNLKALLKAGYDEDGAKKLFTLKEFKVFNIAQCDNISACRELPTGSEDNLEELDINPIESAEAIIKGYKNPPTIKEEEQGRAFYRPSDDLIMMPTKAQFAMESSVDDFYKTLFHEMIHSTGHSSRLNRLESTKFGSVSYSKEELVAEIGAMYLTSIANLSPRDHERNSQAYINGWIKYIKSSHEKAVISAMTQAEKGVQLILN